MSLELKDIRCKIDPRTHAFLSGEAASRGGDVCEIIREVLDAWAQARYVAHMETHKRLMAEGLIGVVEGSAGRAGAHKGELRWD